MKCLSFSLLVTLAAYVATLAIRHSAPAVGRSESSAAGSVIPTPRELERLAAEMYEPEVRNDWRVTDPKVVALIDRLTEVSEEGQGWDPIGWTTGFLATGTGSRFGSGVFAPKGTAHPAMRQLVRSGVAALPDLLDHLDDARPAGIVLRCDDAAISPFAGNMWFADEYDPRYRGRPLPGVNTIPGLGYPRPIRRYQVKVGDLCFVVIGQIVNRRLLVLRPQHLLGRAVNSPVQTPGLAAATRKDWSGLTPEQHRDSLAEDARTASRLELYRTVPRLLFYYPETGEEFALKLLKAPPLTARAGTSEATEAVEALAGIRNDKVDRAVLALFRSLDLTKFEGFDRVVADSLALACMERLAGKRGDTDAEFASYCEGRVRELSGRKREIAEEQRPGVLTAMLDRLRTKE